MTRSQESEVPAFSVKFLSYGLRNCACRLRVPPVIWEGRDVVHIPGWMEHTNENSNFYLNPLRGFEHSNIKWIRLQRHWICHKTKSRLRKDLECGFIFTKTFNNNNFNSYMELEKRLSHHLGQVGEFLSWHWRSDEETVHCDIKFMNMIKLWIK